MNKFRTEEMQTKYEAAIKARRLDYKCKLCEMSSIKEFVNWRIVKNEFPYDRIAKIHDMIIAKKHVSEDGLSWEEMEELINIKKGYVEQLYEYVIELLNRLKSIPDHFHLHLIVGRDFTK